MLPQPATEQEFDALDRKGQVFATAIRRAFVDHAGTRPISATAVGSYPVFHVGSDCVAKLFAPLHHEFFETECEALRRLDRGGAVIAPRLLATAEIDGWNALLMTRLPGDSLKEMWSGCKVADKERLCEALGDTVRSLHSADSSPIAGQTVGFDRFVEAQRRACEERQRRFGLDDKLARQIPDFLASLTLASDQRVLLHTEVMLEHVFAAQIDGQLSITGLLDFEPAMIGAPEYEMASIGVFVAQANSRLMRAFMRGYGQAIDDEFHRRVMGYALLHRYSRLSWYLEFLPVADSLDDLAKSWFG